MTIEASALPEVFRRSALIVRERMRPLPGTLLSPRTVALMCATKDAIEQWPEKPESGESVEHCSLLLTLATIIEECVDVQDAAARVADALVIYALQAVERVPIMPLMVADEEMALDLITGRGA